MFLNMTSERQFMDFSGEKNMLKLKQTKYDETSLLSHSYRSIFLWLR